MREPIAAPNTTKYSEVEITGDTMLCISVRQVRAISKQVDRANCVQVHGACLTRLTKMSSSELSAGPQILEVDAELAELAQQRRRCRSARPCVEGVDELAAVRHSSSGSRPSAAGMAGSGCRADAGSAASCRACCISTSLSSTRMISPLLITPMRSAICSASSM